MANTAISGLTASAADLAATDVLPVVQTTGTGPVKMTGQQLAGGLLGSTSLTGATVTADAPLLNLSQTWNNAGVTFTGLKANITDTASNASSLLMDLQTTVSGTTTSKFSVKKSGTLVVAAGTSTAGAQGITFADNTLAGIYAGSNQLYVTGNGFNIASQLFISNNINISNNTGLFRFGTSYDTILRRRDAANLNLGAADTGAVTATVTITIASPGVVTWNFHGLSTGTPVVFTTTGALPTGITAGTTYYVIAVDASTFQIATSFANALAGTAVNTSGSQSGTHTGTRYAIAQTLSVQNVASGETNRIGSDLVIAGSQGTGNAAGGSIIFRVAPAVSSGTAQNALQTALTISSDATKVRIGPSGGFVEASSTYGIGLNCRHNNGYAVALNGRNSGAFIGESGPLAWSTTEIQTSRDLYLYRDDANKLALRNGAAAQEFRVYNTYSSSTNFERFNIIAQSGGSVIIGTEKGSGGGTARALELQTDGQTRLTIATNGAAIFGSSITIPAAAPISDGAYHTFGGSSSQVIHTGIGSFIRWSISVGNTANSTLLTGGSGGNALELRNGTNAQESRVYGSYTSATNFQRLTIKTLRESSGALSGASYTTTIAIPAYAQLIGVTTRVTTEVTGATSYDVGDGSDVDLWGAGIGVTLGSESRTADFTAVGAVGPAATSRTVTLTANGSNFTAGVIEICLHYLTTEAD